MESADQSGAHCTGGSVREEPGSEDHERPCPEGRGEEKKVQTDDRLTAHLRPGCKPAAWHTSDGRSMGIRYDLCPHVRRMALCGGSDAGEKQKDHWAGYG